MTQSINIVDDLFEQCRQGRIDRNTLQDRLYDESLDNKSFKEEDRNYIDWILNHLSNDPNSSLDTLNWQAYSNSNTKATGPSSSNQYSEIKTYIQTDQPDLAWTMIEQWIIGKPDDDLGIELLKELVQRDDQYVPNATNLLGRIEYQLSTMGQELLDDLNSMTMYSIPRVQPTGGNASPASAPLNASSTPNIPNSSNIPPTSGLDSNQANANPANATNGSPNFQSNTQTPAPTQPGPIVPGVPDEWVEYKRASAAGRWDEAREWLHRIPTTNSHFSEIELQEKLLKDVIFYDRFPNLKSLPGQLGSARNRRAWDEFNKLYTAAAAAVHQYDRNMDLPATIQELYQLALQSRDAEEIARMAMEERKKGNYANAANLADQAIGLDSRFGDGLDESDKAAECRKLFEQLRFFRTKAHPSKDDLLTNLEAARKLAEDISPNSTEAAALYTFMQEDARLPEELAEIQGRHSLDIIHIRNAEAVLAEIEPMFTRNRNLQKFRFEFIEPRREGLRESIKKKADIAIRTIERRDSTLSERNQACAELDRLIGELKLMDPTDSDIVRLESALKNLRSTLDDVQSRLQSNNSQILALQNYQQNNQVVQPPQAAQILTELNKIYQYAPKDYELGAQSARFVDIINNEINRLYQRSDLRAVDIEQADQLLSIIASTPPPETYNLNSVTVLNAQSVVTGALQRASEFWLKQYGPWDQYQQSVDNALELAYLAQRLPYTATKGIGERIIENVRGITVREVRTKLDRNLLDENGLNEAFKIASFEPFPNFRVPTLHTEIVDACIARIEFMLEEAKRERRTSNALKTIAQAEQFWRVALSLYPMDARLRGMQARILAERKAKQRTQALERTWRPVVITLGVLIIIGIIVATTNPYWSYWQVAAFGGTPTPIPTATAVPAPTITPTPVPTATPVPQALKPSAYYCEPKNSNVNAVSEYTGCHNVTNEGQVTMLDFWHKNRNFLGNPITEALTDANSNNISQYFQYAKIEYVPSQTNGDGSHFFLSLLGNSLANCYAGTDIFNSNGGVVTACLDPSTHQPIYKLPTPTPIDPTFIQKLKEAANPEGTRLATQNCQLVNVRFHYVCDDHGFRGLFEKQGGVPTLGAPVTEEFEGNYKGRDVWLQIFERSMLIFDPGTNQPAYQVEIGKVYLEDYEGIAVKDTVKPANSTPAAGGNAAITTTIAGSLTNDATTPAPTK